MGETEEYASKMPSKSEKCPQKENPHSDSVGIRKGTAADPKAKPLFHSDLT